MAAVEVTVAADEIAIRANAAIAEMRLIPRRQSGKDWLVHPRPGARIKSIRKKVDGHLAAVEKASLEQFSIWTESMNPSVKRIWDELGIEAARVVKWKTPGIAIAPPGQGTVFNPDIVRVAVEAEAQKPDNREKLSQASGIERHLFVYVDERNYAVWYALNGLELPTVPPRLPSEITHIWAATVTRTAALYVVWKASGTDGWSTLGSQQITGALDSPGGGADAELPAAGQADDNRNGPRIKI